MFGLLVGAVAALRLTNWVLEKAVIPYRRRARAITEEEPLTTMRATITERELQLLRRSSAWEILQRGMDTFDFCETAEARVR